MKKILTFIMLIGILSLMSIQAQETRQVNKIQNPYEKHVDITAFGGYSWGDYYPAYEAEIKVNGTNYWGVGLGLSMTNKFAIEIQYQMMRPLVTIRPYLGSIIESDDIDVTSNWFLIGSVSELPLSKSFHLFGYTGVGAVYNVPTKSKYDNLNLYKSTWALGVALQGGFKYWITDRIALRGFAALNMPMQFGGVGFYLGTGGSGLGLNSYSSLFLFNLGGGLTFRMK